MFAAASISAFRREAVIQCIAIYACNRMFVLDAQRRGIDFRITVLRHLGA